MSAVNVLLVKGGLVGTDERETYPAEGGNCLGGWGVRLGKQ